MSKYAQIEAPSASVQQRASGVIPSESMESVGEPTDMTYKSSGMPYKSSGMTSNSKDIPSNSKDIPSKSTDIPSKSKKQQDDGRHTRPAQASVIRRSGGGT